jgi:hypothetical protein
LPTELGFTAERLLGDETVWSNTPSVNLLVDQVVKLEDVHDTNGHSVLKRLT